MTVPAFASDRFRCFLSTTEYRVVPGKLRQMPIYYPTDRPGRHGNESFFRRHGLAPAYWSRRSNGGMFFLC